MRTVVSAILASSVVVVGAPRIASAADACTPSRAMIVLDKSSSMVTGTIGATPKWDIAVDALESIAMSYQSSIELGLMLFPEAGQCSPGAVYVEPALGAGDAIVSALGAPPPQSGNYTPMSQTLDVAATLPTLADASRPRYVILITDGWQWCYPYDSSTRFDPVTSVQNLKAMGVTTYVVGFGDAVDALVLNQAAIEGGTAIAGCDPTGDTPSATNPCYFRADSPTSLVTALDTIAVHISAETCDGIDNDCNGVVDEIARDCSTACGVGQETCSAGGWGSCTAQQPAAETCDGMDNDCDGAVDPGCSCIAGETRACGDGAGACAPGVQTCGADGGWGACAEAVGPADESCDGVDNDCDGQVDEEDGAPLCTGTNMCHDGQCVPPSEPAGDGGDVSGCACRAGHGATGNHAAGGLLMGLLTVGLLIVRRRR